MTNNVAANVYINTNSINSTKDISTEAYMYVKNILGANTDLPISDILEMLNQVYISTTKEKKKNDLVKKYIDDINFLSKNPDNLTFYKNNKEKSYLQFIKPDVKTKTYNAVKDDTLSPTLFAYYNCDKSRQILSDREAAAIKSMKFDNDFENLVEDNFLFNPNKSKKDKDANKDFDIISQSSFSNKNLAAGSENNTPYLRKKRKYSMKKKDPKKNGRSGKKNCEKQESFINNRNANRSDSENDQNQEYCIQNCVFKRKYNGENEIMIGCDSCENWYHPKCIGMSIEEVQSNINIDWFCFDCKKKKNK